MLIFRTNSYSRIKRKLLILFPVADKVLALKGPWSKQIDDAFLSWKFNHLHNDSITRLKFPSNFTEVKRTNFLINTGTMIFYCFDSNEFQIWESNVYFLYFLHSPVIPQLIVHIEFRLFLSSLHRWTRYADRIAQWAVAELEAPMLRFFPVRVNLFRVVKKSGWCWCFYPQGTPWHFAQCDKPVEFNQ